MDSMIAFLKRADYYNCYARNYTDIFSVDFSDFYAQIKTRQILREIMRSTFPLEFEKSFLIAKSVLLKKIDLAFQNVTFPEDGVTLAQAAVLNDNGSNDQFMKARDEEEHWQRLDSYIFEKHISSMDVYFLNESGFTFYIPALMQWSIIIANNQLYHTFLYDYIASLLDKNQNISDLINRAMLNVIAKYMLFECLQSSPYGGDEKALAALRGIKEAIQVSALDFCYKS